MYSILRPVAATVPFKVSFTKSVKTTFIGRPSSQTTSTSSCHAAAAKLVTTQFNSLRPVQTNNSITRTLVLFCYNIQIRIVFIP